MSLISVIIPIFGERIRHTEACLDSIFKSTYQKTEVIIVSNEIDKVIERTGGEYGDKIQYVGTDVATIPVVYNTGIKHSRGDLFAIMDVKDITGRMRIELEVLKLQSDEKTGLAFCGMTHIDADGKFLQGVNIFKGFERDKFTGMMFEKNRIDSVSTTLIKKEVFDKIGLFDENLTYESEYDFYLRAASKFKFEYLDLPLLRCRIEDDNKKDNNELQRRAQEEKLLLVKHDAGIIAGNLSKLYDKEDNFRMSLGCVLFRMGKKKEALKNFMKAVSVNDKNADAYCLVGDYYLNTGKNEEAKSYYNKALNLNPNHAECKDKLKMMATGEKKQYSDSSVKIDNVRVPDILCSVSFLAEKMLKRKSAVKV